jgi:hypothetical protein
MLVNSSQFVGKGSPKSSISGSTNSSALVEDVEAGEDAVSLACTATGELAERELDLCRMKKRLKFLPDLALLSGRFFWRGNCGEGGVKPGLNEAWPSFAGSRSCVLRLARLVMGVSQGMEVPNFIIECSISVKEFSGNGRV